MNSKTRLFLLGAIVALPAWLAGCSTTHGAHDPILEKAPTSTEKPAPAPAPVAKDPAPAPAPKPQPAPTPAPAGTVSAALAVPTGNPATSAILLEKFVPSQVNVGQPFDIVIQVKNLTSGALDNVVVTDPLPSGFTVSKVNPQALAGGASSGTWNVGRLGPNETKRIVITGTASGKGALTSCTDVTYESAICLTTEVVSPALTVEVDCPDPGPISLCDPIPVTYKVCNTGDGTATNVQVRGAYPNGATDSSGGSEFTATIPSLAAGECRTFNVTLKAPTTGSYSVAAQARADGGLTANAAPCTTRVTAPSLTINMSGNTKSFIGRQVSYDINAANTGDGVCEGTTVSATIPSCMSFVSATNGGTVQGNRVVWNLGNMAPAARANLRMVLKANTPCDATINAEVNCACADAATASAQTVVTGIPAILLEVIDINDPVAVGDQETYVITVTNQGSAVDTNIKITATLPAGVEFVSTSGATNGTRSGNSVTFAPLSSLAPKEKATWRVVVRAVSEADARFRVVMTSDELGATPVQETEATTYYN